MVSLNTDPETQDSVFTLCPNSSLNWAGVKLAFSVLFASLLVVAVYFVSIGAWLVAPFTGLEAVVLGAGMYLSSRRGATREVIRVREDTVTVYRGRKTLREIARFQRCWARVKLLQDPKNWYPSRLFIGSHGWVTEIGRDLIENERAQLAKDLTEILSVQPAFRRIAPTKRLAELDTARQQI